MELNTKMNNEVIFISSYDEESLLNIDALLNSVDEKRSKMISVVDAENPEDSQIYTYSKFLEIFDNSGLDGFLI